MTVQENYQDNAVLSDTIEAEDEKIPWDELLEIAHQMPSLESDSSDELEDDKEI